MMATLCQGFDRGPKTNGWKLQKILESHHFGKDHILFGPPVGHNTATGESGLKQWAKAPAQTAQNRSVSIFTGQVVRNLLESEVLNRIVDSRAVPVTQQLQVNPDTCGVDAEGSPRVNFTWGGGRSLLFTQRDGVWGVYYSPADKRKQKALQFPKEILDWFVSTFASHLEADDTPPSIQFLTELTVVKEGQKVLLRAHSNYRGEGPWYDFVEINYGTDGRYPARCACFFEWPFGITPEDVNMDLDHCSGGTAVVLIHECKTQTKEELARESLLYSHYTMDCKMVRHKKGRTARTIPVLRCVHPDNIDARLYVIDPLPGNGGIFGKKISSPTDKEPPPFHIIKVKDRTSKWPKAFIGVQDEDEDEW